MRSLFHRYFLASYWPSVNVSSWLTRPRWKSLVAGSVNKIAALERQAELLKHNRLDLYRRFKHWPAVDPYLDDRNNVPGSWLKCRLRCNTLPLLAHIGEMTKRQPTDCICRLCGDGIEDALHFVFVCRQFTDERREFSLRLQRLLTSGMELCAWLATAPPQDALLAFLGEHARAHFTGPPPPQLSDVDAHEFDRTVRNFLVVCWKKRGRSLGTVQLRSNDFVFGPYRPSFRFRT